MFIRRMTAAVAVSVACLVGHNVLAADAKQLGSMEVGIYPITSYLPDYVAKEKGLFTKHGLEVTLVGPALAGSTALQLMTGNKLQVMALDMFTALQAAASGNPIKVIACAAPRSIYVAVARKGANLPPLTAPFDQRMKSMQGKTVAVTAIGAGTDRALLGGLGAASVPIDKVQRLGIGAPAAATAQFNAGKIDVYVTGAYSGAYQILAAAPDTQIFVDFGDASAPETVRTFAPSVWVASGKWVKEQPAQLAAYRAAVGEAIAWIVANPDEAAQVMNATMLEGRDLALAKKSVAVQIANYYKAAKPDLACSPASFDAAAKIFEQQGLGPATQFKFQDIVVAPAATK